MRRIPGWNVPEVLSVCPSCSRRRPGPVPCSRWALPVHDQFRGQGNQQTGIGSARNSEVRDTSVRAVLQGCLNPEIPTVLGSLSQMLGVARLEHMELGMRWSLKSPPSPKQSVTPWYCEFSWNAVLTCWSSQLKFFLSVLCLKLKNSWGWKFISGSHYFNLHSSRILDSILFFNV